jgi:hypothetical protein
MLRDMMVGYLSGAPADRSGRAQVQGGVPIVGGGGAPETESHDRTANHLAG